MRSTEGQLKVETLRRELESSDEGAALEAMKRAWVDITDPLVRWVELVRVLAESCRRFPGVRAHFVALRDAKVPAFHERKGVADWLALNEALDDEARTLGWFHDARTQALRVARFSRLNSVVRRLGSANDYLWLFGGAPESSVREFVAGYLSGIAMARGMQMFPHDSHEATLLRFPLSERRPRDDFETMLEGECVKEVALIVAAFEATEPGNHALREFADGLLDSERLRRSYFRWEDRDVSR